MASVHLPVLCDRVVSLLAPVASGLLVDATVGLGGHAAALLAAAPGLRLLGLDRDPEALRIAAERLRPFGPRVRLVNRPFAELPAVLQEIGESPVAVLADLGCSSLQFDTPERGFSLRADGPLDMRFGPTGPTAADLLNRVSEGELMDILWSYGEERRAGTIARALIRRRQRRPLKTTAELVEVVVEVLGPMRRGRVHPATRTMQAIRIAVNDELSQLESFLQPAAQALLPDGRIAVISFHSLEDRIVKHTLRLLEGRCTCPPDLPECRCGRQQVVKVITPHPVRPDDAEVDANPRARSARMRAAVRVEGER